MLPTRRDTVKGSNHMQLNTYMDHTLLKPNATEADIRRICDEAMRHDFKTVSINSCWTKFAAEVLGGSAVGITTCIGFPLGACSTAAKVAEARQAVSDGTTEIDMVLNVGKLLGGDDDYCTGDIAAVVEAAQGHPVKVILECCLLDDDQVVRACMCAMSGGASFVKTSTGFHPSGGASPRAVELMAGAVDGRLGVKASGGIRSAADAIAMLDAGATRLGLSGTRAVLDGLGV